MIRKFRSTDAGQGHTSFIFDRFSQLRVDAEVLPISHGIWPSVALWGLHDYGEDLSSTAAAWNGIAPLVALAF
jgi:hypothetical protein